MSAPEHIPELIQFAQLERALTRVTRDIDTALDQGNHSAFTEACLERTALLEYRRDMLETAIRGSA